MTALSDSNGHLSNDPYRLLVNSITDYAIYMLDAKGFISNWNAGAERFKGYRADEIVGSHFSRFYTEEDRHKGIPGKALETAAREGKFEAEGWRLRKDGTRFWAHVVIDPIKNGQGAVIGFAKVTRDLTERKATLDALENAREKMAQAQKLAAIGQLTGGIAHDFNNLLMAASSSLTLLRKRVANDPIAEKFIQNAIDATNRGAMLTQRMLAFARRQPLATRPVDVVAMIADMSDLITQTLGGKHVVEARFPPNLSAASADPDQLSLAILNLIINARDAMPFGGVIVISAREHEISSQQMPELDAGRYVAIRVTDQGTGMDAETLARATEPFFTTKGVGKGTGLGLSMIHGLANQLGGGFYLESELGAGTSAEIWLPAVIANETASEAMTAALGPALATSHRPLTILAVDDDALILMNIAAMLTDLGHTVLEAHSGRSALSKLQSHPEIDMMITDQSMPEMTGAQLITAIKQERPALPVILATGYAELPEGVLASLPLLRKPFDQNDLQKAIAECQIQAASPIGEPRST